MKRKFFSTLLALVLVLSLSLVTAVPVAASHDSTATVAFTDGQTTEQTEPSTLDVEVTNSSGSLGNIDEVVIDFTETDFTVTGTGDPTDWTGVENPADFITYTADIEGAQIAPGDSLTFVPAVTNPPGLGLATNPVVTTSDAGSKAVLAASAATGEIAYTADDIGLAGNDYTVEYLDAESFSELSAAMVGNAISVELADDGTDPTSDADAVVVAIDAVATGVTASTAAGATIVPVMSAAALSGGSGMQLDKPCTLTGALTITEKLLDVTVAATPNTSASLANYVISFIIETDIAATEGWITITFPAGYDITDVEAADVTVKDDTVPYTTGTVEVDGQVVTIPAGGLAIAAPSVVEVTITGTPEPVKNPPVSADDYDIHVATSGDEHGPGLVTIIPDSFGVVAGTENEVTAGAAFAVTVTALNADSDTDTGYTGAYYIDFTSTATGSPTLVDFELITFTAGVGVSASYFVLPVAEAGRTISADATDPVITGTSDPFDVNPAALVDFGITGQATKTAGIAQDAITVTALDADGNTVEDYLGTVTWTSTDGQAVLPAAYPFTAGDAGVHAFSGIILKTVGAGTQTITVTDAAAGVSENSTNITVNPAAAYSLVVSASTDVIEADGEDIATITVTALDEFGNVDTALGGDQSLTLESNLGTIADASPDFTAGEATTTLTSAELGTATIRVEHATFDDTTTTVRMLPDIGINSIAVTVDKTSILNNDVDVRTITATYKDTGGDVVTAAAGADYTFTFTIDIAPTDVTLVPADGVVVPENGVATVTLTTTAASGTITVTADGTGAADSNAPAITVGQGTFEIELFQGWNLISLPLIPSEDDIDIALADLTDAETVIEVRTFRWEADELGQKWWVPEVPASTLAQMNDGKGYWINMSAADSLDVLGSVDAPAGGTQPSYDLHIGWNLIGFKSLQTAMTANMYLGELADVMRMMYSYDAVQGIYLVIDEPATDFLVPGEGYWVAVSTAGTIFP